LLILLILKNELIEIIILII